ncbi:MAG: HIT family protein [Candidatus Binataceae bacterium]|jgi:diadenosine tetraphosphate (Ap4A) HIT family hydrolase
MVPDEAAGAVRACGICAVIARIEGRIVSGGFADLVAELPRSWLILGDAQFYRGYCVLFAKRHVTEMHQMPRGEAHELLDELMAVGKTLERVVKPLKLNYECLGNQEPHVHWHVFPRYAEDPMRLAPVWVRPEHERKVTLQDDDRRGLIRALRTDLVRVLPTARFT